MPVADPARPYVLDLGRTIGGDNRAAYLRTKAWSPRKQQTRMECGRDDGLKVWLNGAVALSKNSPSSVSPGSDKADVTLEEGWNTLLLKVINGGGDWGVCIRFRALDGSRLEGIRASTEGK
jgi:hypothetical protein